MVRSNPKAEKLEDLRRDEILDLMLETTIIKIYRVDIQNLVRTLLYIARDYHIQPSEIYRLPFYEFEYMTQEIKQIQKDQEKENEAQNKEMEGYRKSMSANKMMSSINNSMPKMPSMSSMSMPKISIPKL